MEGKRDNLNSVKYFTPKNWRADICRTQFLPSNLIFTLKTVLLSNAILIIDDSYLLSYDIYDANPCNQ